MVEFTLAPALVIGLLINAVLPVLVGLVTTRVTNGGIKATALAGLSLVTGLLTELGMAISAGETYDIGTGLFTGLTGFVIAVGLHYGLYKPTGLTDKAQDSLVTTHH